MYNQLWVKATTFSFGSNSLIQTHIFRRTQLTHEAPRPTELLRNDLASAGAQLPNSEKMYSTTTHRFRERRNIHLRDACDSPRQQTGTPPKILPRVAQRESSRSRSLNDDGSINVHWIAIGWERARSCKIEFASRWCCALLASGTIHPAVPEGNKDFVPMM
jgi:hypothetical protein